MPKFDDMIEAVYCVKCGADITRAMKFYPEGLKGGRYCYDCNEEWKKRHKKPIIRRKKVITRNGPTWIESK